MPTYSAKLTDEQRSLLVARLLTASQGIDGLSISGAAAIVGLRAAAKSLRDGVKPWDFDKREWNVVEQTSLDYYRSSLAELEEARASQPVDSHWIAGCEEDLASARALLRAVDPIFESQTGDAFAGPIDDAYPE